jgi:hypothetical protein
MLNKQAISQAVINRALANALARGVETRGLSATSKHKLSSIAARLMNRERGREFFDIVTNKGMTDPFRQVKDPDHFKAILAAYGGNKPANYEELPSSVRAQVDTLLKGYKSHLKLKGKEDLWEISRAKGSSIKDNPSVIMRAPKGDIEARVSTGASGITGIEQLLSDAEQISPVESQQISELMARFNPQLRNVYRDSAAALDKLVTQNRKNAIKMVSSQDMSEVLNSRLGGFIPEPIVDKLVNSSIVNKGLNALGAIAPERLHFIPVRQGETLGQAADQELAKLIAAREKDNLVIDNLVDFQHGINPKWDAYKKDVRDIALYGDRSASGLVPSTRENWQKLIDENARPNTHLLDVNKLGEAWLFPGMIGKTYGVRKLGDKYFATPADIEQIKNLKEIYIKDLGGAASRPKPVQVQDLLDNDLLVPMTNSQENLAYTHMAQEPVVAATFDQIPPTPASSLDTFIQGATSMTFPEKNIHWYRTNIEGGPAASTLLSTDDSNLGSLLLGQLKTQQGEQVSRDIAKTVEALPEEFRRLKYGFDAIHTPDRATKAYEANAGGWGVREIDYLKGLLGIWRNTKERAPEYALAAATLGASGAALGGLGLAGGGSLLALYAAKKKIERDNARKKQIIKEVANNLK